MRKKYFVDAYLRSAACVAKVRKSVYYILLYRCVFFFKQKTAYERLRSDWSSDVCSSDLPARATTAVAVRPVRRSRRVAPKRRPAEIGPTSVAHRGARSHEVRPRRAVGAGPDADGVRVACVGSDAGT